jgi:hypothetical protein
LENTQDASLAALFAANALESLHRDNAPPGRARGAASPHAVAASAIEADRTNAGPANVAIVPADARP